MFFQVSWPPLYTTSVMVCTCVCVCMCVCACVCVCMCVCTCVKEKGGPPAYVFMYNLGLSKYL